MTLWFDVEDLIVFFETVSRPTGIQRLSFAIYREVWLLAGASGAVRFCRHGVTQGDYAAVDWAQLEADILSASAAPLATAAALAPTQEAPLDDAPMEEAPVEEAPVEEAPEAAPAPHARSLRHRAHDVLFPLIAPHLRRPLGDIYRGQKQSVLAFKSLCRALVAGPPPPIIVPPEPPKVLTYAAAEPVHFMPGDTFVAIGASWVLPNATAGKDLKARHGMRFAVLVHDLIPELYPEWTATEGLALYRPWLHDVVPHADVIFTNSQNTADDLRDCMARHSLSIPPPMILKMGHLAAPDPDPAGAGAGPFDRPFILFVSTIEVRKNHALMLRVWRRLLAELPAAQVPYLVFAGKTGWLTGDLLTQLDNAAWLDGHIRHIPSPGEDELRALYRACAFTVFPSLYEGWGLPVTESLSFGKTVAASGRSAIPEAGGCFCVYFDPENVEDAYGVIHGLITHPERVSQLEDRIAAGFRPPPWAETAAVMLTALQGPNALP
jgi:glycosyltransferase involved in cell wall biosynthesis